MSEALTLLGMAIATFSIRYVIFAASSRIALSPALLSALRYVPPVVLTAIVVPEVLIQDGALHLSPLNPRLAGAIAAVVVGYLTKNLLLTIVVGMGVFFGWQAVLGS
ncbi:MAG: AzlD domain-containing protein [Elainellaceae cyanobacterium]